MNELQVFKSDQFGDVRTVLKDGEVWFVAKDVCEALGLEQVSRAMDRLDEDECGLLKVPHPQSPEKNIEVNAVNEPGLYQLVISSIKPEAKAFKRWITHDVIPSIRKWGIYAASGIFEDPQVIGGMVKAIARQEHELQALRRKVEQLRNERKAELGTWTQRGEMGYASETHPASKIFIETINEMIDNGDVKVIDLEDAAQVRANIGANVIGFEDEDYLYVMSVKAFHWVTERCRARGEAFPSQKALNRALREAGMIEWDATARRSTRVKMVGGKPMRLLWIKRRALEKG